MKHALFSFLLLFLLTISSLWANHPEHGVNPTKHYTDALDIMRSMLEGEQLVSFRDAVFITENAYYDGELSYGMYLAQLIDMVRDVHALREGLTFHYPYHDKYNVYTNAALFQYFTDTVTYQDSTKQVQRTQYPFVYNFDDPLAEKDWQTMFVTKLMKDRVGNCHSLPYLYKILADEFKADASLALAPNHIYINHLCHDPKVTYYNTELTSGTHPIDAFISLRTYMTIASIRKGVYGLPLDDKQSVVLCLVDLANGYIRKFPERDHTFPIQCLDLATYSPDSTKKRRIKA